VAMESRVNTSNPALRQCIAAQSSEKWRQGPTRLDVFFTSRVAYRRNLDAMGPIQYERSR
jgi:hypothetical protein